MVVILVLFTVFVFLVVSFFVQSRPRQAALAPPAIEAPSPDRVCATS